MPDSLTDILSPKAAAPLDMGARLKVVREQNGLSQRELAKRSNVTHSSISMIEQGQNSPSINSLEKILSGIPMTLAQFFVCDPGYSGQIVYRSGELTVNQKKDCGVITHHIPHKNSAIKFCFQKVILSCGADTGEIPLIATHPISGYVMSGQFELTANMQVSTLKFDDAFTLSAKHAYRLRNFSTKDNCVLLICEA